MSKAKLVSIIDAAHALGYNPTGNKLSAELRMLAAIRYLSQFKLTKIEPDPAFFDQATGKSLPFAIKKSEVKKLIKKIEVKNEDDELQQL